MTTLEAATYCADPLLAHVEPSSAVQATRSVIQTMATYTRELGTQDGNGAEPPVLGTRPEGTSGVSCALPDSSLLHVLVQSKQI